MKISTNTRNAVNCLLDLAICKENNDSTWISLKSIAKRQSVSMAYLEQIFAKLRRAGLITAIRGPNGGYSLARESNDITIADIMEAVEASIDTTGCHGEKNCRSGNQCLSHDFWHHLNNQINNYMKHINIQYLVDLSKKNSKNFHEIMVLQSGE